VATAAQKTAKTVRFTHVVERAGQPHVHTLWVAPDKDRTFKQALQAHRVMTVDQSPSGHSDVGLVGFDPAHRHGGQFLIFPKSLKAFEGARVVGIKFDLVEQPKAIATPTAKPPAPPKESRREKSPAPRPPRPTRAAKTPPSPAEPNVVPFPRDEPEAAPPHAERATRPAKKAKAAAESPATSSTHRALVREVRAAMKELQAGKSVAAYQRLEHALKSET
jgi:hypothetical protein